MSLSDLVLSIDLGTSGPKVALLNRGGTMLATAVRSVATHRIEPDGAEQDPHEVWRSVEDAIAHVLHAVPKAGDAVIAISIASQYSSVVPVDANADPVGNMILWMDARGGPHSIAIHGQYEDVIPKWAEVHGIFPLPNGADSLSHVLWIKNERPEVYERAHCFLEPMDFVAARLTRRFTSNACSAFMMLLTDNRDLSCLEYDAELVRMAGIDRAKLADLVPISSFIGTVDAEVARRLGLSPRAQVLAPMNDSQAIAIGTGTHIGDHAGITMGTTSAILTHVPFKRSDFETAIISMPSPIAGRYVVMAENGLGAKALDYFLRDVVFADDGLARHHSDDPFAGVESAVASVAAGSGGVLFLPWLVGSQAPASNQHMRGGFLNMTLGTSRAQLVRSILEGVAFNLRWLMPAVAKFSEHDFDHVRLAGGAALSSEWCQILADVLDRPAVQLEDPRHVINRATAFLAYEKLGVVSTGDHALFCPGRRTFEPRPAAVSTYHRLFAQFLAAYERTEPIFAALN